MSPFWGHNALKDMLCHLIQVTSSHDIVSASLTLKYIVMWQITASYYI